MTDQEILDQFEALVDDSLDITLTIQLANNAKNKLERQLKLLIHQKQDSSNSTITGQTYATGINLATDFSTMVEMYLDTERKAPIPFKKNVLYRSNNSKYWIDHRQRKIYFGGTQSSARTVNYIYIYKTDDITEASVSAGTTTITWPTEFHSLIAYEMVKMWYEIDQASRERSWRQEWQAEYTALLNALIDWDADLKLAELDGQTPYGDDDSASSSDQLTF